MLYALRGSARIAAPSPSTLRAETEFPAASGVLEPLMKIVRRAKPSHFLSTRFLIFFSLAT
jgi:hypothetical protein